ncbi:ArsR family transcriptional regulator [Nocardioides guangzhouensis]|uniref:ArsR family transcriptional regulator n=1 Tax=Nocardioides guangzhouensis TaxID=2497878 RepID=A0A4Q4ZC10_9ACTN|nr:ArsR family transcriptional regulator [Nocardioides guangzhouensis]RYP85198.1 ArsR family transcriptional regulator [Nocardioides guangzhouensis]
MRQAPAAPPPFVRLAGHPVRWRLLVGLATGDHRVRELVDLVGQPQNLVSYHLRLLRDADLVTARRSSFDGRDSYYRLDLDRCRDLLAGTGASLHPALAVARPEAPRPDRRLRVLFACTGNSARSPVAEALLRERTGGAVDVASAGSHPAERTHPSAVRVLAEDYGIDVSGRSPQALDALDTHGFDVVVTLCDRVREVCPELPGHPRRIHWSMADPAPAGTPAPAADRAVRRAAREIDTRIGHLLHVLPTLEPTPDRKEPR